MFVLKLMQCCSVGHVLLLHLFLQVAEAVTLFLSLLYVHMKHVEVSIGWDLRLTQVTACTLEGQSLRTTYSILVIHISLL